MSPPVLCYWNNIPSPYLVERLDLLADRGEVEVIGLFDRTTNPDRSWDVDPSSWRFESRVGLGSPGEVCRFVERLAPTVLATIYAEPLHRAALPRLVARRVPVVLRVLPTYDTWVRRSPAKEAAKHALFRAVGRFKVPGPAGEAYVRRYCPSGRVWHVPQTVPVAHFAPPSGPPDRSGAADPTRALRLLFVGRLVPEKGVDDLLSALADPSIGPVSLTVAGDGPLAGRLHSPRPGVAIDHVGYVQRDHLPKLLHDADALVFPTHGDPFGLVVEEALAAGLPVVTSDAAGDIVRRVSSRGVGLVHPRGDVAALRRALRSMADPVLRAALAARAAAIGPEIDHARYAEAMEALVGDLLEGTSR